MDKATKTTGLSGLIKKGSAPQIPEVREKERLVSLTVKVDADTFAKIKEIGMKNRLSGNSNLATGQGIVMDAINQYLSRHRG